LDARRKREEVGRTDFGKMQPERKPGAVASGQTKQNPGGTCQPGFKIRFITQGRHIQAFPAREG
jgi:hypothetical protein